MSTTGRQSRNNADALASSLDDADFVRLLPAATGDGLAAAGVLARALRAEGVPFQITVTRSSVEATCSTEADCEIALGRSLPGVEMTLGTDRPASVRAFETARAFSGDIEGGAILAAAGVTSTGRDLPAIIEDALSSASIQRRPGVAVPTTDIVDGLAHSTLFHAPFSGDCEKCESLLEARDLLDPDEEQAHRRVGSLVALATVEADEATARASTFVERVLRPYVGGPFSTIGGYADVLDSAVRVDPGIAIALALGHDDARASALSAWRTHAQRVHETLREGDVQRHDGLVVVEGKASVETVGRLCRDFRSPESRVLVTGQDYVALATTDDHDASSILESATAELDEAGPVAGSTQMARQMYSGDGETLLGSIREVIDDE